MAKLRLDSKIFELGLCDSREKASKLIMAGCVYVNEQKASKASQMVEGSENIEIREGLPFVSRGGFKIAKAFEVFNINVEGKKCADIGASTGGFTDCLLQNGALMVYALDVGYGQLDWKLRNDPRVKVMERTNARYMQPDWYDGVGFACMDVSFISIKLILRPLLDCLDPGSDVIALIKPQFEAGREKVGKKGVVRDSSVHVEVILAMLGNVRKMGYKIKGLDFSPIKGPEGNIEFLLHLNNSSEDAWAQELDEQVAKEVVSRAKFDKN